MIILIGTVDDAVMRHFGSFLKKQKSEFIFLNQAELGNTWNFICQHDSCDVTMEIIVGHDHVQLDKNCAIYARLAQPDTDEPDIITLHQELSHLLDSIPICVINRSRAMASNGSKPFQLHTLAFFLENVLLIPDTYIFNDSSAILRWLSSNDSLCIEDQYIYKSLSDVRSKVAALSNRTKDDIADIYLTPIQFQRRLHGVNVRVHVINDKCCSTLIHSDKLDYRYGNTTMEAMELDPAIEQKLISIVSAMGLSFAGIDLIRTDDNQWYILEVNPHPGYAYFEQNSGQNISQMLLDFMNLQI